MYVPGESSLTSTVERVVRNPVIDASAATPINDIAPSRTRSPPGADPLLCRMSEPKDAESNIEHGGYGGESITCPSVAAHIVRTSRRHG